MKQSPFNVLNMKHLALLLLLIVLPCHAQSLKPSDPLWKQIEAKNKNFSEAFVAGNVTEIMKNYRDGTLLFPEHSMLRKSAAAIQDFYSQWLAQAKVDSFSKTILEIRDFNGYALEVGTFIETFTKKDAKPYTYNGKYMVVWRISGKNESGLYIASELWGANTAFNDADLPQINDEGIAITKEIPFDKALEKEVRQRNALIKQLVTDRKGEEHSHLFLPNAMYMTYYTPILSGIEAIRPYFIEHEKPGDVVINSVNLDTYNVFETTGKIIIEYGFYKVDYTYKSDKGTVSGKSINIWKRDKNGQLMLYRQAVNHD